MSYKDLYKLSAAVESVRSVIEHVCLDEKQGLKKDVDPSDIIDILNSLVHIRECLFDAAYDLENGII